MIMRRKVLKIIPKPQSESSRTTSKPPSSLPIWIGSCPSTGVWNCVTIVYLQNVVSSEDAKRLLEKPSMRAEQLARIRRAEKLHLKLTKALHDAGARVLLGTDTANPFVIPGFSIHEELQNFVDAGLTPYQALKAGTSDAAEFLKKQDEFGTVAVGRRADLILLEANPLDDVRNAARRVGVMVHGRWFSEAELQDRLEKLAASYAKQ